MYSIEIRNAQGDRLAFAQGEGDARLVYDAEYKSGDAVVFSSSQEHVAVMVDQAVALGTVYLPGRSFIFHIPFDEAKSGYAPQAFTGELHAVWIGPVEEDKLRSRRNVARNPLDQRGEADCYPHAVANVETRGEGQFWARNVIDGMRFNEKHGKWPYHSWGIGGREDAWIRVDFGRPVTVDELAITLRADFPHDAWWERATLEFSDGHTQQIALEKTVEAQRFDVGERTVTWVRLRDMIKADDPSPFPALTQIEVYGHDAGQ